MGTQVLVFVPFFMNRRHLDLKVTESDADSQEQKQHFSGVGVPKVLMVVGACSLIRRC